VRARVTPPIGAPFTRRRGQMQHPVGYAGQALQSLGLVQLAHQRGDARTP